MYTASTRKRIVAYFLDQCINYILYTPLVIKVFIYWLKNSHDIMVPWSWLILTVLGQTLYQIICYYFIEALPGQWVMGLKIVSVYHPEMGLNFFQCLIHSLGDKLKWLLGHAIYFTGFANRERRHFINLLAETKVVQKESRDGLVKPRMFLALILSLIALGSTMFSNAKYFKQVRFTASAIHIDNFKF